MSKKNQPNQAQTFKFKYKNPVIVEKFYADDKINLSEGMQKIYTTIKNIAIDDLPEDIFKKFYYIEPISKGLTFIKGNITDITINTNTVGFLYATFYENKKGSYTNVINKKPAYVAKAFHAVAHEFRQTGDSYDRLYLHEKYIAFYAKEIFYSELQTEINNQIKNILPKATDLINIKSYKTKIISSIKNLIPDAIKKMNVNDLLSIEILAENPTTYKDVCENTPNHVTIPRDKKDDIWLQELTVKELIKESSKLYYEYENGKDRPLMLVKAEFKVNTAPEEWYNFFTTTKVDKKFYLWQNFNCPDYALLVIIPVNPAAIFEAIIKTIRKRGPELINEIIDKVLTVIKKEAETGKNKVLKKLTFLIPDLSNLLKEEAKKININNILTEKIETDLRNLFSKNQ